MKIVNLTGPEAVKIGAWQLIEVHRDRNNKLRCVVDGTDRALGDPSVDGEFLFTHIMNNNKGISKQADPFAGDLAAFVLYSSVLTDQNQQDVRDYFDRVYGFRKTSVAHLD